MMMMIKDWSKPDREFSFDECLSGCCGYFQSRYMYFQSEFPDHIQSEEYMFKLWGRLLKRKRIVLLTMSPQYLCRSLGSLEWKLCTAVWGIFVSLRQSKNLKYRKSKAYCWNRQQISRLLS